MDNLDQGILKEKYKNIFNEFQADVVNFYQKFKNPEMITKLKKIDGYIIETRNKITSINSVVRSFESVIERGQQVKALQQKIKTLESPSPLKKFFVNWVAKPLVKLVAPAMAKMQGWNLDLKKPLATLAKINAMPYSTRSKNDEIIPAGASHAGDIGKHIQETKAQLDKFRASAYFKNNKLDNYGTLLSLIKKDIKLLEQTLQEKKTDELIVELEAAGNFQQRYYQVAYLFTKKNLGKIFNDNLAALYQKVTAINEQGFSVENSLSILELIQKIRIDLNKKVPYKNAEEYVKLDYLLDQITLDELRYLANQVNITGLKNITDFAHKDAAKGTHNINAGELAADNILFDETAKKGNKKNVLTMDEVRERHLKLEVKMAEYQEQLRSDRTVSK